MSSIVTVTYDTFFPEVLPYVRDCPEFVALNAIRNACMEFCDKTLLWRELLDDITIVPNQAEYDLDIVTTGAGLASVITAQIGKTVLIPSATEQLNALFGGDWRTLGGPVNYIMHDDHETIRLVMVPSTTYNDPLSIMCALRPLKSSIKVGKVIYERYAEVIGFGARARLHDTPGQPYYDETAAKKFRTWFESGYGEAKIAANRALGRTNLVVRPPRI